MQDIEEKIYWTEKRKSSHCSGHRVGTADTFLLPVRPPEIEISKKNLLDRKTKMLAYCLEYRVFTTDTSLLPCDISKKNFWTEKRIDSHTAHSTALVPLTPPYHLWEILNKKCYDWKQKCSHTFHGTALAQLIPFFHLCDLQKSRYRKKLLDRKTKMLAHCSRYRVGTADTSLLPVRDIKE